MMRLFKSHLKTKLLKALRKQSKSQYRIIQKSYNDFEIQRYQNITITTCWTDSYVSKSQHYEWTPLLIEGNIHNDLDEFKKTCHKLRNTWIITEVRKLRKKYPKKQKYPIVLNF